MKFTALNVNGTASGGSKVPVETLTQKGYLTLDQIAARAGVTKESVLAAIGTGGRIKSELMPDALLVESVEDIPIPLVTEVVAESLIGGGGMGPPLETPALTKFAAKDFRSADYNDGEILQGWRSCWNGFEWECTYHLVGMMWYRATSAISASAESPDQVIWDAPVLGSGQASFTATAFAAVWPIGFRLRAAEVWYVWNGEAWEAEAQGGTVDATIIDGSANPVAGNAVFDALAGKAPATGINPAAITGTAVVTGDARLSDERVPTAAGLTSKFGTAKTTLVDADKVPILDSAATDTPKHGLLSALWTYIKAKIGATALTFATRPLCSDVGTSQPTSLITMSDALLAIARDNTTHSVNFAIATSATAAGGESSGVRGYWQLFTSTSAGSKAHVFIDVSAIAFNNLTLDFSRRTIFSTRVITANFRSGLQYYCQLGRTLSASSTSQLDKKGFGFGVSGSTVTPFVHNGTTLTTTLASGSTFSIVTYPLVILDFLPGVALHVYGISLTSSTPVLLASITTGLPTGFSIVGDGQLEWLLYDTGSGGANNWTFLGKSSFTVI